MLAYEVYTSWLGAIIFSRMAEDFSYQVEPGGGLESLTRAPEGPYDQRLGYARLPDFLTKLQEAGYETRGQARASEAMRRWVERGGFPVYPEKNQAGLRIFDRGGRLLYGAQFPGRAYSEFDEIPELVVETLRFVENRELLDPLRPYRNPAIEWSRFSRAVLDVGLNRIFPWHPVSGGSTLATQLEKLRHSPGGFTHGINDKLRQMTSASLRAYLDGRETLDAQRRIFRDYVNSIPLAAAPGYGEVHGLGDGLWAWFGEDFDEVNRLLRADEASLSADERQRRAVAFRKTLALLLALKKPTEFLVQNPESLAERTDAYLRIMPTAGIISPGLARAALALETPPRRGAPHIPAPAFVERKAVDAVRGALARGLGVSLYELDRLDLTVRTSLDRPANAAVVELLTGLHDPQTAAEAGILAYPMLSRGDPQDVVYSFTLYERAPEGNLLRVQADTWPSPLNINEGAKLELGSTAKLRTLVSYLNVIQQLHQEYAGREPEALRGARAKAGDALTGWALGYLLETGGENLDAMLDAALMRTYSASPHERFFTGGGVHTFRNFEAKDNHRVMTVREAFQRSVNLVFIRMMRDIARYHMYRVPGAAPEILEDRGDPRREAYLRRFADLEGREFMRQFYRDHAGRGPAESLRALFASIRKRPQSAAAVHRYLWPEQEFAVFVGFMREALPEWRLSEYTLELLHQEYGPEAFDLQDRAYIAGTNPLRLWLVKRLLENPESAWSEIVEASAAERQEAYRWLFRTRHKSAQDKRIRIMMEHDAFERLHAEWKLLGFPFDRVTPSYASSIGSSADRPAALAELVGVLLNDGVRRPPVRTLELHFAEGTPYETLLAHRGAGGFRVLHPAVAAAAREEMLTVVESGTGRRARGAIVTEDGGIAAIGGKTGTGDNRTHRFGPGGRVLDSRVMNRTGTFVFFVGDRFYGVVTAYVPGEKAAEYRFTSALPAQVFRTLAPAIQPLWEAPDGELQAGPAELAAHEPSPPIKGASPGPETP